MMQKLIVLMLTLMVCGCHTIQWKQDNVKRIVESHNEGFKQAVNAGEKSEKFVRECFKTIADLEFELEKR